MTNRFGTLLALVLMPVVGLGAGCSLRKLGSNDAAMNGDGHPGTDAQGNQDLATDRPAEDSDASMGDGGGGPDGVGGGSAGSTGAGGAGTGGAGGALPTCEDNSTRSCKDDGALGNCAKGTETCTGGLWSGCSVAAATMDECQGGDDANCNGTANEGCACVTGTIRFCSADGIMGNCAKGAESCTAGKWGPCSILPLAIDSCVTKGDDANCNGMPNDHCPCVTGDAQACGPPVAIGVCKPGVATCMNGQWGACQGAVNKAIRNCTSPVDNDCDGKADNTVDTVCNCISGSTQPCGAHPGNDGNGPCHVGTQTCVVAADKSSSSWSACAGAIGPAAADTCVAGNNDNCSGPANEGCLCIEGVTTRSCGVCNDGTQTCSAGKAGNFGACSGASSQHTYYRDQDGDGHGNPSNPTTVCGGAPAGYLVSPADDCCDMDPGAHPGVTQCSTSPNACGSYDWNCDGGAQPYYTKTNVSTSFTSASGCKIGGSGWQENTAPACGATGTLVSLSYAPGSGEYCQSTPSAYQCCM